jgi:hypothetical protein
MNPFNLPSSTFVGRVVPKNSFDDFITRSQKKMFTDRVSKIIWLQKISKDTVNLSEGEIKEIQVFEVQLKDKASITPLLEVIQRAIPYAVVNIVTYSQEYFISTAAKHSSPLNPDRSVVDWMFTTDWSPLSSFRYSFPLAVSLEYSMANLLVQLTNRPLMGDLNISSIARNESQISALKREIESLISNIQKESQYKKKVEMNLVLLKKKSELESFIISLESQ